MYYLVLGNLQCTVHDMKTESELFGTTMLIVLIMNTLHAMQEKLKDSDIFKRIHLCLPLTN